MPIKCCVMFEVGSRYATWKVYGYSVGDIVAICELIQQTCQAHPDRYQYTRKYKMGVWDGYIRLAKGTQLPSGLVLTVCRILEVAGYDAVCTYTAIQPDIYYEMIDPDIFDGITLRDYQLDAARKLLEAGRGIAKMATNSGKTEVMALICMCVRCSIVVLTTSKDLLYQTSERISKRIGEPVGIIGDGVEDIQRVTVAMIQTLSEHPDIIKLLQVCDCAMYDECHHVSSRTSQDVMYQLNAVLRFGFSGTPLKNDVLRDLMLIGATGDVVIDVGNAELIDSGISARPVVEMYNIRHKGTKKEFKTKWKDGYDQFIVHNNVRNELIAYIVTSNTANSVLILVNRKEHGRLLSELIPHSKFVSYADGIVDRVAATNDLRAGNGAIVVSTPIFDEGVDLPAVDMLVLAGGGKAFVKILQRLGRGMRRKEGRNELMVIDFIDDTNFYLLRHSLARAEIYEAEGFEVHIVEPTDAST